MTVPTGLAVSGNPITGSGTLALSLASGYAIPTTSNISTWNTAYGWGNHASAGYAAANQTMYIGTTGVAINRGTGALTLEGITLTSPTFTGPTLGTPVSGNFSTGSFTWPTFNQNTSGTAAGLSATLAVTSGGTGLADITAGSYIKGNGTNAVDPQTPAEVRTDLSLEHKSIVIQVYDPSQQVAVADGIAYISIPHGLAGWSISNVQAHSYVGTSGNISILVYNSNGTESTSYSGLFGAYHIIYAGAHDSKSNSTAQPLYNLGVDEGYTLMIDVKGSDNSRYGLDVRIDFTK
jgi:hypothetical protein